MPMECRMRTLIIVSLTLFLIAACGGGEQAASPAPSGAEKPQSSQVAERGGTIQVGDQSFVLVAKFCSVYPGPIVNIAGHAKDDPSLEIVFDHGGPDQIVIGSGGGETLWHAMKSTMKVEVDGKAVSGTATFNKDMNGLGESAEGSFDLRCG